MPRFPMPDPGRPKWGLSSKMIIDATRQLDLDDGPKSWALLNRELLAKGVPGVFARIDRNWSGYMKIWTK